MKRAIFQSIAVLGIFLHFCGADVKAAEVACDSECPSGQVLSSVVTGEDAATCYCSEVSSMEDITPAARTEAPTESLVDDPDVAPAS